MNLSDRAKVGLSVVGAVLLVLLCVQLLTAEGGTSGGSVFAAVFLVLLVYAGMRFFKKKR